MTDIRHIPVLLEETIDGLGLEPGDTVVDATLGSGGHSLEILKKILPSGILIALDVDPLAIERFKQRIRDVSWAQQAMDDGKVKLFESNYSALRQVLDDAEIDKVDAIVADLGFSSDQMDRAERGMSFLRSGPLDMRLGQTDDKMTAADIVNGYVEADLIRVLKEYGEERFARNIARALVEERSKQRIVTTEQLADIVKRAIPKRFQAERIHPATKTFQALRIEVNRELEHLEAFLPQAVQSLKTGGRLAIISFHSGEDRIVKQILRQYAGGCICPPGFPVCRCDKKPLLKLIAKKPIIPSEEEVKSNPRARSAKLRLAEKIQ